MTEKLVTGRTLPEAYHKSIEALYDFGEISDCPDYGTRQKELSMTLCVEEPLSEPMISRLFIGGFSELEQYRQEMLDGILDFEVERGNWEYTYHSRIAPQLPFILRELRRNPDSRRAVIDVREWRHDTREDNDSPACLQHIHYFIRGGKLCSKVLFRSNDAVKATYMNAFALIMMQQRLALELNVGMGSYTHRANSFHAYERDFALLEKYVSAIRSGEETTYRYEGEWDELMEEAKPEIQKKIEELKNR
jgi:Thymidylate synthase